MGAAKFVAEHAPRGMLATLTGLQVRFLKENQCHVTIFENIFRVAHIMASERVLEDYSGASQLRQPRALIRLLDFSGSLARV